MRKSHQVNSTVLLHFPKKSKFDFSLTISVLQSYCAVTTEYGIPSDFVRKSTASLQIKISAAQLNFSNIYIYNSVLTCRQHIINSSASAPPNSTKIAMKKDSDVDVCMFEPEL